MSLPGERQHLQKRIERPDLRGLRCARPAVLYGVAGIAVGRLVRRNGRGMPNGPGGLRSLRGSGRAVLWRDRSTLHGWLLHDRLRRDRVLCRQRFRVLCNGRPVYGGSVRELRSRGPTLLPGGLLGPPHVRGRRPLHRGVRGPGATVLSGRRLHERLLRGAHHERWERVRRNRGSVPRFGRRMRRRRLLRLVRRPRATLLCIFSHPGGAWILRRAAHGLPRTRRFGFSRADRPILPSLRPAWTSLLRLGMPGRIRLRSAGQESPLPLTRSGTRVLCGLFAAFLVSGCGGRSIDHSLADASTPLSRNASDAAADAGGDGATGCGSEGQPCCPNEECEGGSCQLGTCIPCGGLGESCCQSPDGSPSCNAARVECRALHCSHCGNPGEACCSGGDQPCTGGCCVSSEGASVCIAEGSSCPQMDGACAAGMCANCGRDGQRCCNDEVCSGDLRCSATGLCFAQCGAPGQPCCPGNICTGGCCASPSGTSADECVTVGQACPGVAGTCATDGSCTSCGGLGQGCCALLPNTPPGLGYCAAPLVDCLESAASPTPNDRFCQACGQSGLPCCHSGCQAGSVCEEGSSVCN